MKGIILAGGLGTRLYPITQVVSKQLLPVYDKPMIFYPLSVLMLANIKDILIISTEEALPLFKKLLGDGSQLGISLSYKVQDTPRGLADALIIGEEFINNDSVALILGDNIFYGSRFTELLTNSVNNISTLGGSIIFSYTVSDPTKFGVVEFDKNNKVISLEEKPKNPKSNQIVTGLYFYDNNASNYAKGLKPSPRGEIEITDLNMQYLNNNKLVVEPLGRGFAWLDTGTPDSLMQASEYIKTIEINQGFKISCPEEIAYFKKFIDKKQLTNLSNSYGSSSYGQYLKKLLN
ncbi:glucose-1-phosphate thymidylyltransferase RfbA [Rickettsiales bacterium LUAb2]